MPCTHDDVRAKREASISREREPDATRKPETVNGDGRGCQELYELGAGEAAGAAEGRAWGLGSEA